MTVRIRHDHHDRPAAAVVDGVDTPAAVTHLCRSLAAGVGLDDDIVVIDLTSAPDVAVASSGPLRLATSAMSRHGRWLAVVDPSTVGSSFVGANVYSTSRAAALAGRQYFALVTGRRSTVAGSLAAGRMVVSLTGGVPGLAMTIARRTTRGLSTLVRVFLRTSRDVGPCTDDRSPGRL